MRVALLDRRMGTHGGHGPNRWTLRHGIDWNSSLMGQENTFAIVDAFGEVMLGPLEVGTDYAPIKDYDLVYLRVRDGRKSLPAIENLRETCKGAILICYIDEWVNHINFTPKTWIAKVSKYFDAVTSGFGQKYEEEAFKKMGVDNYVRCPYAGPVRKWRMSFKPREEKEDAICGMWHIRSFLQQGKGDRVHSKTLNAMRYLQNKHGVKCWFFLNFDGWKQEDAIRNYADKIGLEVELLKHMSNIDFERKMASALVFMEEYQCPSFSRATVVSAAVGTPQVGNDMNEPSAGCFPDLTVEFGDWDKWTSLADRLISDEKFWTEQRDMGLKNVDYYYYPAFKGRIMKLYNKLKDKANK